MVADPLSRYLLRPVWHLLASLPPRSRLLVTRLLTRFGFGEASILVPLAALVGLVTAVAAVAFHELIGLIRDHLYRLDRYGLDPSFLYGKGIFLLVLLPALGGLAVGAFSTYVMR